MQRQLDPQAFCHSDISWTRTLASMNVACLRRLSGPLAERSASNCFWGRTMLRVYRQSESAFRDRLLSRPGTSLEQ